MARGRSRNKMGQWGDNWVAAVDAALWAALLTGSGAESVSLNGTRLILLYPPIRA